MVHVRERDGGGLPRLELVVPRAVGTAVERNRVRRRIRELWRELVPCVRPMDCVVVVRPVAGKLSYRDLGTHLRGCLRRLGAASPTGPAGCL